MKNRLLFVLAWILISAIPLFAVKQVSHVEFVGLKRTKSQILFHFIKTQIGKPFSASNLNEDIQELRNLGLFSQVNSVVKDTPTGVKVIFELKEWRAREPILRFGGIKKNFWFDLGLKDFNWLGRGYHLGGFYRYYDRHSGALFLQMPRLGSSRWGIVLNTSLYSTIEPAYFTDQTTFYNVDRWEFILGLLYQISNSLRLELAGGYLGETYRKNTDKSGEGTPGPGYRQFDKWLIRSRLLLDKVDYKDLFLQGIANDITLEHIYTVGEPQRFWKVLNISRAYIFLGKRGNFALRSRVGVATNVKSPFVPFVLDSYLTVRGVGNRVARGTAEVTFNFEYRHLLWQKDWAALQGVVFLDWSAWRPAGGTLEELFEPDNIVSFGGLGLRIYLRKLNNLVLRMDLGINLTDSTQKGIVLGLGHYF